MKKYLTVLLVIMLAAVLCLAFAACEKTDDNGLVILDTPKVTANGNTVSWNSVNNAVKYGVIVNERDEIEVTATSYVIKDGGKSKVKVRAIGDGKKYGFSDYSEVVEAEVFGKLATPTLNELTIDNNGNVLLTWTSVEGATAYNVVVTDTKSTSVLNENVNANTFTINAELVATPNNYNIKVKAIGNGQQQDSEFSNIKIHTKTAQLAAPGNVVLGVGDIEGKYIYFEEVDNADRYVVEILKNNEIYLTYDKTGTRNNKKYFNIENMGISEVGSYTMRMRAEKKNSGIYYPSEYVDIKNAEGIIQEFKIYAAPTGIEINKNGILTWNAVDEDIRYDITATSNNSTNISIGYTKTLEYDLKTSNNITGGDTQGVILDVKVYVSSDYTKYILKGLVGESVTYNYVKKPELTSEGEFAGYYKITSIGELNYVTSEPDAKYYLANDLNGKGGSIYALTQDFKGIFNGNNYSINNVNIVSHNPSDNSNVSLFGNIAVGAEIKNLGLFEITIKETERNLVSGAAIANVNYGLIDNVSVICTIDVSGNAAGVAIENRGKLSNVFAKSTVTGYGAVGGIVVTNSGSDLINTRVYSGTIIGKTLGNKNIESIIGGIAAINTGVIRLSGVTKTNITATSASPNGVVYAGGLVGALNGGTVRECYINNRDASISARSTAVNGTAYIGGMAGKITSGTLTDSYMIYGQLSSADYAACFAATIAGSSKIENCYVAATGVSTAHKYVFSVTHESNAIITNNYYFITSNIEVSGSGNSVNGLSRVTDRAAMRDIDIATMGIANEAQSEFKTISNMLYFKSTDTFSGGAFALSAKDTRTIPEIYTGNGVKVTDPSVKCQATKSGGYSFDKYIYKFSDDLTLSLMKVYKINN